jgi:hypothetical protein
LGGLCTIYVVWCRSLVCFFVSTVPFFPNLDLGFTLPTLIVLLSPKRREIVCP